MLKNYFILAGFIQSVPTLRHFSRRRSLSPSLTPWNVAFRITRHSIFGARNYAVKRHENALNLWIGLGLASTRRDYRRRRKFTFFLCLATKALALRNALQFLLAKIIAFRLRRRLKNNGWHVWKHEADKTRLAVLCKSIETPAVVGGKSLGKSQKLQKK